MEAEEVKSGTVEEMGVQAKIAVNRMEAVELVPLSYVSIRAVEHF